MAWTQEEAKLINATAYEKLASDDPVLFKQALDVVNDYTRTKMREDGVFRKLMPPIPIQNDELDRSVEGHIILELFLEKGGHEAIRTVVRNITPGHDVVNCRRLRSGRLTVVT